MGSLSNKEGRPRSLVASFWQGDDSGGGACILGYAETAMGGKLLFRTEDRGTDHIQTTGPGTEQPRPPCSVAIMFANEERPFTRTKNMDSLFLREPAGRTETKTQECSVWKL